MTENGSMIKKTHRSKEQKQGKSNAASAEMAKKMDAIHAFFIAQQISFNEEIEKLRFLNSVQVKPIGTSINNTICKFAETIDKGKNAEDVMLTSYKPGKVALEMADRFVNGIGCEGRTWFDLHCAATELLSHGKSNEMSGDRPGDAEARRHYDLWFGTRANKLDAALTVALEMAKMQA